MNPEPRTLILESLSRPDISPELRAMAVDYLSGVRSTELRNAVRVRFYDSPRDSLEESLSAVIYAVLIASVSRNHYASILASRLCDTSLHPSPK